MAGTLLPVRSASSTIASWTMVKYVTFPLVVRDMNSGTLEEMEDGFTLLALLVVFFLVVLDGVSFSFSFSFSVPSLLADFGVLLISVVDGAGAGEGFPMLALEEDGIFGDFILVDDGDLLFDEVAVVLLGLLPVYVLYGMGWMGWDEGM